jgi:hypothetical protein
MLEESRFKFHKTGDTLLDTAIEAFIVFPYNPAYVDKLVSKANSGLRSKFGTSIYCTNDEALNYITISSNTLGSFTKNFDIHEDFHDKEHFYSKYDCTCMVIEDLGEYTENEKFFKYDPEADKSKTDHICECIVPYYATNGKRRDGIPLLVNIMPEFVSYILS